MLQLTLFITKKTTKQLTLVLNHAQDIGKSRLSFYLHAHFSFLGLEARENEYFKE